MQSTPDARIRQKVTGGHKAFSHVLCSITNTWTADIQPTL